MEAIDHSAIESLSPDLFPFHVACCGDTEQPNDYTDSWADFYAQHRLLAILKKSERTNGKDPTLRSLVEKTATETVPRLIGDKHLNGGKGVTPVVVHGDLWSGNKGRGRIGGQGAVEDVVFDPSACYAHSEYELGIMKMFGGFGGSFLKEYHQLCPKTEPVDEYEDRVALYELYVKFDQRALARTTLNERVRYHHLNHHAIFGGKKKKIFFSIPFMTIDLGPKTPFYPHFGCFPPCSVPELGPQDKVLKQMLAPTPESVSLIRFSALDQATLTQKYTQGVINLGPCPL